MSRYIGSVCKMCRREQMKLFLKGDKCYTKCVLEKRPTTPGAAKPQRGKPSEFLLEPRVVGLIVHVMSPVLPLMV